MSTKHQKLMDEAYEHFTEDMSYEEFIDGLDELHRDAVLLGNMSYEHESGGFGQWVSNAYDRRLDELIETVKRVSGSVLGTKVIAFLITVKSGETDYTIIDEEYETISEDFLRECNDYFVDKLHSESNVPQENNHIYLHEF